MRKRALLLLTASIPALTAVALFVSLVAFERDAHATTFSVVNTSDVGAGSLREVIISANADVNAPHTINIGVNGTINLASNLPTITKAVTINGGGPANLTVRRSATATFSFPVFTVNGVNATFKGMTISNGAFGVGAAAGAGGINSSAGGTLSVTDCTLTANTGPHGAIHAGGPLAITGSSIAGNTATNGSGIVFASDTSTIDDSTFSGNLNGSAIWFSAAAGKTMTIDGTAITGNDNGLGNAGLTVQGGAATVTNTTFSGNSGKFANDLWTFSDTITIALDHVTTSGTGNTSLLFDHNATVSMKNTIIAGSANRCTIGAHVVTTLGHNMSTDATCGLTGATDKPSTNPLLGTLGNHGGSTPNHLLGATSPAINGGDNTGATTLDQRGLARISGGTTDIGAVEMQAPNAPVIGAATPGNAAATVAFSAPAIVGDGAITSFTTTCTPGNVTTTGAASPAAMSPLTNGTLYTCSVVATNPFGTGPASGTVTVTPVDPDAGVVDSGVDSGPDADAAVVVDASTDSSTPPQDAAPADDAAVADTGPTTTPPSSSGGSLNIDSGIPSIPIGGAGADDCECGVLGAHTSSDLASASRAVIFLGAIAAAWARRRKKK